MNSIVNPVTGRRLFLGRRRPVARGPRLRFRNYLMADIAPPPSTTNYRSAAAAILSRMFENDQLGDCTAAGAFHAFGVMLANAGVPFDPTDEQVVAFYSATTGYVPGNPSTDQGGDEQTVLNYLQQHGLCDGEHKAAAWLSVDGSRSDEVKQAIYLAENVYFGVELPDAWLNPEPSASGFVWDVAGPANPDNGHCFVGVDYDEEGVFVSTWGMVGKVTWPAVAKYATTTGQGELYTILSKDSLSRANAKAPSGLDWSQMIADVDSVFDVKLAA